MVEANSVLRIVCDVWCLNSCMDSSARLEEERHRLGMKLFVRIEGLHGHK